MNICLLSREYPPDTAWGGIGTYTYNLAGGLARKGQNVHVICQSLNGDREYLDNGVYVHRVSHKPFFALKYNFREFGLRWEYSRSVYHKLKEIIDSCGIDIVEGPNLSGEGFIYSFHKRTPLITRLHTHFSEVINFLRHARDLDTRLSCWVENATIFRSDLVTCSTRPHAELVCRQIGLSPDKIRIVPLGVALPDLKEGIEKEGPGKSVLYVGRLEKRKGIHVLVGAIPAVLEAIPDATFLIAGRDSPLKEYSYKEKLIASIPEQCRNRARFLGYVPDEELDKYYRACDVFVAPSLYESFGLIYTEAMSYAKPVIGCSVGGVCEVIEDGVNGLLVPPLDAGLLSRAIIRLLKDGQGARRMGLRARELVERKFSIDIMIENTMEAYRRVCH